MVETPQADELRASMVNDLMEVGAFKSGRIAEAIRSVPRHIFAPGESLESAYAPDKAVVAKRT